MSTTIESMAPTAPEPVRTRAKATSVRFLSQNRPGKRMGMGHYERLLIKSLNDVTTEGDWQFDITFDGRAAGVDLDGKCPGIRHADMLGFSTRRLTGVPWPITRSIMRMRGVRGDADLYHSLALTFPAPPGKPAVYTIHDLPPARFSDEGKVPRWAKRAANKAAAIITPSNFAKIELMQLLDLPEERLHVIPYGCEHDVFHTGIAPASAESLAAKGISGPFLVYAGGFTQRKNVRSLTTAWKALAARYTDLTLALVGPKDQLQAIVNETNPPRVVVAGYLDHAELRGWMKASVGLVFPSIYEGFGMPPQEAMALGVPVVCVRAGALPEVVGDAGILAENGTPDAIEAAVRKLIDDPALADRLREAGPRQAAKFSWERQAHSVLKLYRDVLDAAG